LSSMNIGRADLPRPGGQDLPSVSDQVSPPAVSSPPALEEDKVGEIVVVKEGQTISSMAEQF